MQAGRREALARRKTGPWVGSVCRFLGLRLHWVNSHVFTSFQVQPGFCQGPRSVGEKARTGPQSKAACPLFDRDPFQIHQKTLCRKKKLNIS